MRGFVLLVIAIQAASCLPVVDELMTVFDGKDTAIVESTVREVRAAVPDKLQDLVNDDTEKAFLHTYSDSDGDDNERGYHKRSDDEGGKGYKHFDSFHKKDGDKYGFETHSAYGKYKDDDASGKQKKKDEQSDEDKESYEAQDDAEEKGEDEEESKATYKVVEDVDEDGDSGLYQEDDAGAEYGSYHAEAEDKEDKEEEEDDGEAAKYTDEGDAESKKETSGAYNTGSSGYTFGGDDEGDGEESERYEEEEEEDD